MNTVIMVVAYEAEGFIQKLLTRIPPSVLGPGTRILVSDDASTDRTAELARAWAADNPDFDVTVIAQPTNLGYGGNQKFCFRWSAEAGADVAVLLHGDEQYPPEQIGDLVDKLEADPTLGAVYGSRMMIPGHARQGGMPMVRFVGNKVLSRILNRLAGTTYTEWFSGFRAYRLSAVDEVDLTELPPGFDLDAVLTLRLVEAGHTVDEVPIPTHYGEELSRVPLVRTGLSLLREGAGAHRRMVRARRAT